MNCYYAWNTHEDILRNSASGGIFTALAEYVLNKHGIVFGACVNQDTQEVRHIEAVNMDELAPLRGSKYQQSRMDGVYKEVAGQLKECRPVLFSGTPCQVAALHNYLDIKKISTELLICAEILCHGVTNTKVVHEYIKSKEKQKHRKIRELYFRTKDRPWYYGSSMKLVYQDGRKEVRDNLIDPFYIAYVNSLVLRPSCYACSFARKEGRRGDFTIGDFWGAENYISDKEQLRKGISLVLTNTAKGEAVWSELTEAQEVKSAILDFDKAVKRNGALVRPAKKNPARDRFFSRLGTEDFSDIVHSVYSRKWLKNRVHYVIGYDNMRKIQSIKRKLRGK